MHLEILVEELSAEAALKILIPRIVGTSVSFAIHPFQGKPDLLRRLPARLRGYAKLVGPAQTRIVVLVDEDRQDCRRIKDDLEKAAAAAGLPTKTSAGGAEFVVLNRLAVEELEAWFFGDGEAIHAAYPRVPASVATRAAYRDPDAIKSGTAEALERVLKNAGYHRGGLAKVAAAREIAEHMEPSRNRSTSFQHFCAGLRIAASQPER